MLKPLTCKSVLCKRPFLLNISKLGESVVWLHIKCLNLPAGLETLFVKCFLLSSRYVQACLEPVVIPQW